MTRLDQIRPVDVALPALHRQVLRATLGDRAAFDAAWDSLRPRLEPDQLYDGELMRLLPLVDAALSKYEIDEPLGARLRGVRRRYWYENQLLKVRLGEAAAILAERGIDVLVLKGGDLAFRYYDDPGLRPMRDLDVLVRTAQAPDAFDALLMSGFRSLDGELPNGFAASGHAMPLVFPDETQLDLHWHLRESFITDTPTTSDEPFWKSSESFAEDSAMRCLAPEDLLVFVLVGGVTSPGARWVADAVQIARARPQLQWSRVVDRATEYEVEIPVRVGLQIVEDLAASVVPPQVLDDLGRADVSRHAVRSFRRVIERPESESLHPSLAGLAQTRQTWTITSANWSRSTRWSRFPQWLADVWGVRSPAHLPGAAARRVTRRVREVFGPSEGPSGAGPPASGAGG
jgi:hypothetical protein